MPAYIRRKPSTKIELTGEDEGAQKNTHAEGEEHA